MTDDKIREACARALEIDLDSDQYASAPIPLDGNTAMALLMTAASVATDAGGAAVWVDTPNDVVMWECSDGVHCGDLNGVSPQSIILACLLALGEISAEDVADNA